MKHIAALVVSASVIFSTPSIGNELLLEWTRELPAASPQLAVELYLGERGIRPGVGGGGLTYTSKIVTPERDYLFCNEHLSSIVEGEYVNGAQFNFWMTAFLATQQKYGDPSAIKIENDWRHIKFMWHLADDTSLFFLVRAAPPDQIIWTRELIHEPSSLPCR